ncbi:hypothetical protein BB560_002516 [Smittium megazygosporum]|uniref:FAD-binding PCMH-type domain-containing protein n=1 Tax=Smittium megazygosporum TaxID=133381 RepID=A0A2T9ZEJ0_9FUNG|nr:hypothetical protein BB560_002516 [Smittium megazygosporum]
MSLQHTLSRALKALPRQSASKSASVSLTPALLYFSQLRSASYSTITGSKQTILHQKLKASKNSNVSSKNLISKRFAGYTPRTRNPNFKQLTAADVGKFGEILPKNRMLVSKELGGSEDTSDMDGYNTDWIGIYKGKAQVVLFPINAQEVSQILKYCNSEKIAVVPQGGNTGLVGASVPVFDEVIISLQKMNKVRSLDQDSGALVCDAGCVLEVLDNYLADHGLTMPLDLGAKGSCHIGGNVSTNAGGIRYLKYGSLHGSVLGLEAVLPDGTIVNNLSTLRKDSTGYDIKQLFIGAEGTIGIVTGVSILAARRPSSVNASILGANSYEDVRHLFKQAKSELSEILSAFEFWDSESMTLTLNYNKFSPPFETLYPFYVLIETSGSNTEHDEKSNLAQNGILAQDKSQFRKLWDYREKMPQAIFATGYAYKFDLSIPISKLHDIVGYLKQKLTSEGLFLDKDGKIDPSLPIISVNGFGHIGDGNLHLNVLMKNEDEKIIESFKYQVYDWIKSMNGSISAEHGLGIIEAENLHYSKTPEVIDIMKKIKHLFDPNGIMNPYKFFPPT